MEKIVNNIEDEKMERGYNEYNKIEKKADEMAKEISANLLEKMIKEEDGKEYNLSTMIMAVSKTLTYLSSYLYDNEEEFTQNIEMARKSVVSDLIPTLLHPEPCCECENCKNGDFENCVNLKTTPEFTTSRFLPLLCNMIIEYDIFNKILWLNTSGILDNQEEDKKDAN
jgi:hypothetical protein